MPGRGEIFRSYVPPGFSMGISKGNLAPGDGERERDSGNLMMIYAGWWFGCHFLISHIYIYLGNFIILIDFHLFQRGGPTTRHFPETMVFSMGGDTRIWDQSGGVSY